MKYYANIYKHENIVPHFIVYVECDMNDADYSGEETRIEIEEFGEVIPSIQYLWDNSSRWDDLEDLLDGYILLNGEILHLLEYLVFPYDEYGHGHRLMELSVYYVDEHGTRHIVDISDEKGNECVFESGDIEFKFVRNDEDNEEENDDDDDEFDDDEFDEEDE